MASLGQASWTELEKTYTDGFRGLLEAGSDALLLETLQDLLMVKATIIAAQNAMAETGRQVPLFVQVTNRSKLTFEITRESFTLEDPLGNQYSMVPARELAENYPRLELDRRLFRQNRQFTAIGVGLYTFVESGFYPVSGPRSLLIDKVSLPPRAYMEDVLYFPIPETGLNGVPLRLLFKVKQLEEPIEVKFEVPKTLGIFEKDDGGGTR